MEECVNKMILSEWWHSGKSGKSQLWSEGDERVARAFYFESKYFISGLLRYSFDVGISDSWKMFLESLKQSVDITIDTEDGCDTNSGEAGFFSRGSGDDGYNSGNMIHDIESLSSVHQETLDRIHWRLFLRSNQQKLHKVILDMMQCILAFSRLVSVVPVSLPSSGAGGKQSMSSDNNNSVSRLYKRFKVYKQLLLKVMREKESLVVDEDKSSLLQQQRSDASSSLSSKESRYGFSKRVFSKNSAEWACFSSLILEIE